MYNAPENFLRSFLYVSFLRKQYHQTNKQQMIIHNLRDWNLYMVTGKVGFLK